MTGIEAGGVEGAMVHRKWCDQGALSFFPLQLNQVDATTGPGGASGPPDPTAATN